MQEQRKKIWIDGLQTYLLWRIGLYCLTYYLVGWLLVVSWLRIRESLESAFGPTLAASVLPIASLFFAFLAATFIIDALKLTHRFVGPLYRIRKTIQAIAAGEAVDLVVLRKDDLLVEMKDEFNAMLKALEARGAVVLKPERAPETEIAPAAVAQVTA